VVTADIDDVIESPANGVTGETTKYESAALTTEAGVAEEEVDTPTPDYDTMYAAECIFKHRSRKGGKFLVSWMEPDAEDTWTKKDDLSDDLLLHWWSSHTRKGVLRKKNKKVQVSIINAPGSRAYRRTWPES